MHNVNNKPSLFKDPKKALDAMARQVIDESLTSAQDYAMRNSGGQMEIVRMPKYLQVTKKRAAKHGVIDLKPFFARSSHKKYNRFGQWYMTVPLSKKTRKMSRRMYDDLRSRPIDDKPITVSTKYLYDRYKQSPSSSLINYKPKSLNITIQPKKWGNGTRRTYVSFRTVNAKSPVNSWIVNRERVNEDEMSKTLIANIDRLIKWKLKHVQGGR